MVSVGGLEVLVDRVRVGEQSPAASRHGQCRLPLEPFGDSLEPLQHLLRFVDPSQSPQRLDEVAGLGRVAGLGQLHRLEQRLGVVQVEHGSSAVAEGQFEQAVDPGAAVPHDHAAPSGVDGLGDDRPAGTLLPDRCQQLGKAQPQVWYRRREVCIEAQLDRGRVVGPRPEHVAAPLLDGGDECDRQTELAQIGEPLGDLTESMGDAQCAIEIVDQHQDIRAEEHRNERIQHLLVGDLVEPVATQRLPSVVATARDLDQIPDQSVGEGQLVGGQLAEGPVDSAERGRVIAPHERRDSERRAQHGTGAGARPRVRNDHGLDVVGIDPLWVLPGPGGDPLGFEEQPLVRGVGALGELVQQSEQGTRRARASVRVGGSRQADTLPVTIA